MHNAIKAAWVCFDCRIAVRRSKWYSDVVSCPECGGKTRCIGCRIPVPPKRAPKAWKKLYQQLTEQGYQSIEHRSVYLTRRRHGLEQEISRLESLPHQKGLSKAINKLRKKLESLDNIESRYHHHLYTPKMKTKRMNWRGELE